MAYNINDENGELMRVVHRKEEAEQIVAQREGWVFKYVRNPVRQVDLSSLGEAPF